MMQIELRIFSASWTPSRVQELVPGQAIQGPCIHQLWGLYSTYDYILVLFEDFSSEQVT